MKIALAFGVAVCCGAIGMAQTIHGREGITLPAPPPVQADPVTDNYCDTKITDSYRWLEDAKSAQEAVRALKQAAPLRPPPDASPTWTISGSAA